MCPCNFILLMNNVMIGTQLAWTWDPVREITLKRIINWTLLVKDDSLKGKAIIVIISLITSITKNTHNSLIIIITVTMIVIDNVVSNKLKVSHTVTSL